MQTVSSAIMTIVTAALVFLIAESAIADGGIKKAVLTVNGIAFLLAVLEPVLALWR
ncbi:MAG: hypothetical protein RRY79_05945 [Clostridia bacterium]